MVCSRRTRRISYGLHRQRLSETHSSRRQTMGSFVWDDPFLLDRQLDADERAVRDAARAYSQDRLAPRIVDAFRRESTDPEIFQEMGALGLLGPTIPEQDGGGGLGY